LVRAKRLLLVSSNALLAAGIALAAQPSPVASTQQQLPFVNRDTLPAALRNVPLEHLSSGALMLLNKGDLVQPSAAASARSTSAPLGTGTSNAVALDPRVGANIRLGDDPAALPQNQRAQAEPHIARSIVDPDFLVVTFQEGRFASGGGGVDCGYSISTNGGLIWTRALIPNLTSTSGGAYTRATDPVAAVDLNGNVYLNTLAANPTFDTGPVVVSKSTDGGATFGAPTVVYQPPNASVFADKNWIAINTFSGTSTVGRIVATFTLFSSSSTDGGQILRAYSDNGGASWSSAAAVAATTNAQGSQPVFLPNGNVAVVYWNFGVTTGGNDDRLEAVISSNGGQTFGSVKLVANAVEYAPTSIRSGVFLPSAVGDRTTNNLYVVYQTVLSGNPKIAFTKSTDGGNTWSAPIAISDNPAGAGVFNPAINSSPDGQTLTAVFYDQRNNSGSNVLVDLYLAQSFDGGATWKPNIRLSSVSTDASLAPLTPQGYMLGDYQGVAETTNVNVPAVPVWIDTRTGNPDPFVTRVGMAPQLNFTSWQAARLSLHQINDPALGGQSGDADGDGEDNLSEFNSMTDPNDPSSVVRTGKPRNISTRLDVQTGDNVGIAGFIITGSDSKKIVMRAIGPSLAAFNIPNPLQDPTLELHDSTGAAIAFNNDWQQDAQAAQVQANGLAPFDSRESAMLRTLAPGAYTAIIRGNNNTTGVGLAEVYDVDPNVNSTFTNISTRGFAETGDNVMIGGVIVGGGLGANGAGSTKVLLRGIGPTLSQYNVPNPLQDPVLELHDGNGATITSNDNWRDTQETEIAATGMAPPDDRESAIVTVLTKGNYTAILRGKNNTSGNALVELYKIQ
jgi:hypothetical protein